MRYGVGRDYLCNSWRFGVTKFMWNGKFQLKFSPDLTNSYLWGIPKETRWYYFYNPFKGKVFVTVIGVFLEKDFISKGINGMKLEIEEIQESQSIDTPMEELDQET